MSQTLKFPVEILEMVFAHLHGELKNLTEVSPCFNDIISSSICLMQSFELHYNEKNGRALALSKRKYSKINVESIKSSPALLNFVKKRSHISDLHFISCEFTNPHSFEILSSVAGNLKKLEMKYTKFKAKRKMPKIEMKNLEELSVGARDSNEFSSYIFFSVLVAENLKVLHFDDDPERFLTLLKAQEKLTELTIEGSVVRKLLSDIVTSTSLGFKAASIHLRIPGVGDFEGFNLEDHQTNLLPFLMTQRETLTILKLVGCGLRDEDVDTLLKFPNLKTLELRRCRYDWNLGLATSNRTIVNLVLVQDCLLYSSNRTILGILEKCRSLKSLTLSFTPKINIILASRLKRLAQLKLFQCEKPADPLITAEEILLPRLISVRII